jgi:anthranilate synthase component 2
VAILMIDNYDSFTFNLVQDLGAIGEEVVVVRNDAIDVAGIEAMAPEAIVVSPGPCTPNEAGVSVPAIAAFAGRLPILGVCLGHQAMGQALGGTVVRAARLMHGKTDTVAHDGAGVFRGLPERVRVMRYHSLALERASLPEALAVTATSDDGEIMGVRHRAFAGTRAPLEGVQFHPESFLTEHGQAMLRNFLSEARTAA